MKRNDLIEDSDKPFKFIINDPDFNDYCLFCDDYLTEQNKIITSKGYIVCKHCYDLYYSNNPI